MNNVLTLFFISFLTFVIPTVHSLPANVYFLENKYNRGPKIASSEEEIIWKIPVKTIEKRGQDLSHEGPELIGRPQQGIPINLNEKFTLSDKHCKQFLKSIDSVYERNKKEQISSFERYLERQLENLEEYYENLHDLSEIILEVLESAITDQNRIIKHKENLKESQEPINDDIELSIKDGELESVNIGNLPSSVSQPQISITNGVQQKEPKELDPWPMKEELSNDDEEQTSYVTEPHKYFNSNILNKKKELLKFTNYDKQITETVEQHEKHSLKNFVSHENTNDSIVSERSLERTFDDSIPQIITIEDEEKTTKVIQTLESFIDDECQPSNNEASIDLLINDDEKHIVRNPKSDNSTLEISYEHELLKSSNDDIDQAIKDDLLQDTDIDKFSSYHELRETLNTNGNQSTHNGKQEVPAVKNNVQDSVTSDEELFSHNDDKRTGMVQTYMQGLPKDEDDINALDDNQNKLKKHAMKYSKSSDKLLILHHNETEGLGSVKNVAKKVKYKAQNTDEEQDNRNIKPQRSSNNIENGTIKTTISSKNQSTEESELWDNLNDLASKYFEDRKKQTDVSDDEDRFTPYGELQKPLRVINEEVSKKTELQETPIDDEEQITEPKDSINYEPLTQASNLINGVNIQSHGDDKSYKYRNDSKKFPTNEERQAINDNVVTRARYEYELEEIMYGTTLNETQEVISVDDGLIYYETHLLKGQNEKPKASGANDTRDSYPQQSIANNEEGIAEESIQKPQEDLIPFLDQQQIIDDNEIPDRKISLMRSKQPKKRHKMRLYIYQIPFSEYSARLDKINANSAATKRWRQKNKKNRHRKRYYKI